MFANPASHGTAKIDNFATSIFLLLPIRPSANRFLCTLKCRPFS